MYRCDNFNAPMQLTAVWKCKQTGKTSTAWNIKLTSYTAGGSLDKIKIKSPIQKGIFIKCCCCLPLCVIIVSFKCQIIQSVHISYTLILDCGYKALQLNLFALHYLLDLIWIAFVVLFATPSCSTCKLLNYKYQNASIHLKFGTPYDTVNYIFI